MKELTIREFGEYCRANNIIWYIFSSSNQNADLACSTMRFDLEFTKMTPLERDGVICFGDKNNNASFRLSMIHKICIQTNKNSESKMIAYCRNGDKTFDKYVFVLQ